MADVPGKDAKGDYSFGQVAIKENLCTFEQVKECLDIQQKLRLIGIEPKKLGDILVDKGYLTPEQAIQVSRSQTAGPPSTPSSRISIPGYEIICRVGQGGMGTVYKARQVSMDRLVAIKILASKYAKDPAFCERFTREARAVAKLNHENVISGIDVGEVGGIRFFVMEFVDGVPVNSILHREGRLDERRVLDIGLQISRALAHAHRHRIVHRDVKPENIMMTSDGVAKLCDLGLAKQSSGEAALTMDGSTIGTPNYISPEQARGEEAGIDIRTDIYSLGATLYHMATGTPPYSGPTPVAVMTKHVTDPLENPLKRNPSLSDGFCKLVVRMMEKRREERPQDPAALIAELERLIRGGSEVDAAPAMLSNIEVIEAAPKTARSLAAAGHARSWRSRAPTSKTPLLVVGGVVAAFAFIFFVASSGSSSSPPVVAKVNGPVNPVTPPSSADPDSEPDLEKAVDREIEGFRSLVETQIADPSAPDRFTRPFRQIHERIESYANKSQFGAEKRWREELSAYVKKVDTLINERVWEGIRKKVEDHYAAGRYVQALDELSRLEEVYKWFRSEGKPEKTSAGRAHESLVSRIDKEVKETYVRGKSDADQAFHDPKRRDEAYRILDGVAATATASQKTEIERTREKYLLDELKEILGAAPTAESYRRAQDRIRELKALHTGNSAAQALLDRGSVDLQATQTRAVTEAASRAGGVYTSEFAPKFAKAMQDRDLPAARKLLHAVYFGKENVAVSPAFLAPFADVALLKSYLDPDRAAFADTRKVIAAADEGCRAAQGSGSPEAVANLCFDLRTTALLEDLLDQAVAGAVLANKDTGRFKTGYSDALRDATNVAAAARKPGGIVALDVTLRQGGGTSVQGMHLTPRSAPAITEDDIVALARRSYSPGTDSAVKADRDPTFALKAFFINWYAERLPAAKSWFDKLSTPELKSGLARFTDKLKGTTSDREEADAAAAYTEATKLFMSKNQAASAKKFRECLDRFSHTEYMKAKQGSGKTRNELAEAQASPGVTPASAAGGKAVAKEIFGATDVKETGKVREITYDFKDDKELALFSSVGGGSLSAARVPTGGVRLEGNGLWYCAVPFKGNVILEVVFKMETDGGVGFALHATDTKAGYAAFVDLPVPNVGEVDVLMRMPLDFSQQLANSLITNGGQGLDVAKDMPSTARFVREGTRLRFTLNRGNIEGDSSQFNEGHVGVGLAQGAILIQRIRIIGEVDRAWIDAELKKLEAKAK